ncbi:cache domain-containing protein [Pseudomonas sp.]|uniref:cache domain-containing protein n=1 Tax=Pseudomonas sp. TaxID=306 RepID=UPI003917D3F3
MSALHTIKARYTLTFVIFIVLLIVGTVLGIRQFVTPMLVDAGKQITLAQVGEIGSRIKLELAQVQAQSRSITQTVALLDSDAIDRLLPGLVDQYGDAKVFGGGIWPLPDKRTPGRAKHSTFYHRDAAGKLMLNEHWNSAESLNYFEQPWHRAGMQAPRGHCVWAAAYQDDASAEPRTNCAMTIYKDGEAYGVSTIDLTLGFFNELVARKEKDIEGEVMVVEADGKILSNQPEISGNIVLKNVSELAAQSPFIASIQAALKTPNRAERYEGEYENASGEDFTFFLSPIEGTPWLLAAALPTRQAPDSPVRAMVRAT